MDGDAGGGGGDWARMFSFLVQRREKGIEARQDKHMAYDDNDTDDDDDGDGGDVYVDRFRSVKW